MCACLYTHTISHAHARENPYSYGKRDLFIWQKRPIKTGIPDSRNVCACTHTQKHTHTRTHTHTTIYTHTHNLHAHTQVKLKEAYIAHLEKKANLSPSEQVALLRY